MTIFLVSLLIMVLLIWLGMHIAFAMALVSFFAVAFMKDFNIASNLLSIAARDSIATFEFGVVPLFVLMGIAVAAAGLGRDAYTLANALFGRILGGIGHSTVAANAVFASVTGLTLASATVFSRIAVPEMLRSGYAPRVAVGIVAGSSMLGMLLPPSLILIITAVLTDLSIGRLFLAGLLPGALMAFCFSGTIYLIARLRPKSVGADVALDHRPRLSALELVRTAGPIVGLILAVIGGIYGGVFTPTEAGAVGAALALIVGAVRRKITWASAWKMVVETGQVTAAICILVIGATMYSRFLALSGAADVIAHLIAGGGFGLLGTLLIFVLILLFLGTFMDSLSTLFLTVPIAFPIFLSLGADPYWFCIITVIVVELGLVTPPLGMTAFVIKSSLDDRRISLHDIYMGSLPFMGAMLACTLLLALFPWIVTFAVYAWS